MEHEADRTRLTEAQKWQKNFSDKNSIFAHSICMEQGPAYTLPKFIRERSDLIARRINRLSRITRTALVMIYSEGRTFADTAELLGLTLWQLWQRIDHAKAKIKKDIEEPDRKGTLSPCICRQGERTRERLARLDLDRQENFFRDRNPDFALCIFRR
jgi:hypothetical protein